MLILSYVFYTIVAIYSVGILLFLLGLYFPKKSRSTKKPFVSVVVAARNEEDNIGKCLDGLARQTYPKELHEIIIVSDNSQDRTDEIIESYSKKFPNIRLLRVDGVPDGITPKKNAITNGIKNSKGEIIVTTDADCEVKPTWVETMVSYFTDEIGMVVGFSQFGKKGEKQSLLENFQALDFLSLMASAEGSSNLGIPLAASGQNLAYRREAFEQVGGYAKVGHRVSGDDVLLLQLVKHRTKWKICFAHDEKSHNVTKAEKSLADFINQRIRWASNGPYQIFLDIPFFLYILNVFLANVGLITSLVGAILSLLPWKFFLITWSVKTALEFIVMTKCATAFRRTDLLKYFPVWALLQIPYIVLVGSLSSFGNFTWKDRKHGFMKQYLKWGEKKRSA